MSIPHVDSQHFSYVVSRLRSFFDNYRTRTTASSRSAEGDDASSSVGKGGGNGEVVERSFVETHPQNRLSILSACENPSSISCFQYAGQKWPLPQTNQMWLEYEIMRNPSNNYYCVTTSYRQEKEPIPGRHDLIFPMFEFEAHGQFRDLLTLLQDLVEHLGYPKPEGSNRYPMMDYEDICRMYDTDDIGHEEEQRLYREYGPVVFITNFPERTSPFFNMSRDGNTTLSRKCDVILSGMETIGTAERSNDVADMRHRFETISDGEYAQTLYRQFGQDRVDGELNDYFGLTFFNRIGAGMGLTRLIKSMTLEGLLPGTTRVDPNV